MSHKAVHLTCLNLSFSVSTRRNDSTCTGVSKAVPRERNEESTTKVQAETRTLTHGFRLLLSSARVFFAARFAWFWHLAWTYPCLRSIRCFRSQHSHREANRVVPAYLLVRSLTHAVSTITEAVLSSALVQLASHQVSCGSGDLLGTG